MFINAIAHYLPEKRVGNEYYAALTGLTQEDIFKKSGIISRSKASAGENTNTMALSVMKQLENVLPYPVSSFDLIIGATYTPYDTVATLAHTVQRRYRISGTRAVSISSACSSFVNAVEIVQTYAAAGKTKKALIVVAEHNTVFNDETNPYSGFLWGDGAAALAISTDRCSESDLEILDVETRAHAEVGKGPEAVYMRVYEDKIQMPDGKDVFVNASKFMTQNTFDILERNNIPLEKLSYLIPHQANMRIMKKVGENLGLKSSSVISNIQDLGNTGSASAAIALSQSVSLFRPGDIIVVSVFGGGYSSGSILIRK